MRNELFIGNLDFAVTEEEVKTLLSVYGTVLTIKMRNKKGYAFAEMSEEKEADEAILKLDGIKYKDREIRISLKMKAGKAKSLTKKRYHERVEKFSKPKPGVDTDKENFPHERSRKSNSDSRNREKTSGEGKQADRKFSKERFSSSEQPKKEWTPKKEWAPKKPASGSSRRDDKNSGYEGSRKPYADLRNREKTSGQGKQADRKFSKERFSSPGQPKKEWAPKKTAYFGKSSRNDENSGYGRYPKPKSNFRPEESHPGRENSPPRDYSGNRSGPPRSRIKEGPSGNSKQKSSGYFSKSKPRTGAGYNKRISRRDKD